LKILAIDPSPTIHAYVFWDTGTHDFYGPRMGLDLFRDMEAAPWGINRWGVDLVACEFPQSYGITAGMSVFATAYQAGKVSERFPGKDVALFGRPSIKGQIGGRKDSEINASLRMRHGEARKGCKLEGVKKDIWAALALAVALDENPNLRRVEI
jgi:hypothetical protein